MMSYLYWLVDYVDQKDEIVNVAYLLARVEALAKYEVARQCLELVSNAINRGLSTEEVKQLIDHMVVHFEEQLDALLLDEPIYGLVKAELEEMIKASKASAPGVANDACMGSC